MFQELDIALDNMLSDKKDPAIPDDPSIPAELKNAEKSFITPDRTFAQNIPTVTLFLYDVKENRELRDPVPTVEKLGNTYVRRQPPLRVDCSYIATTWSIQTGAIKVAEEHRLLSQAVQWLSRFPTIPEKYLPADWMDKTKPTYQPFPPPMWIAQMDPNKNAGEFWVALGVSPRSAFYLTVTIAMDLASQVEGDLVTTKITGYRQTGKPETEEIFICIGGRVLTNQVPPKPIAGARVVIDKLVATTTDTDGRYVVDKLAAGTHTLHISAPRFKLGEKVISVPGPPTEYEIKLDRL